MSTRVTRDVDRHDVADLADAPPRAHLAYVADGRACVLPVTVRSDHDGDVVGVRGSGDLAGVEVHLVRDAGRWWFQLRALAVRATLHPTTTPSGTADDGRSWYRLRPTRTVAWDYGMLRRTDDA